MRGPRVFETLKPDWETFLPNAVQPGPWNAYPDVAGPCANHPHIEPGALVLASFSEFGNLTEVDSAGLGNVLVAQNWTYVRYLAAYDRKVFDTIVERNLYNLNFVGAIVPPVPGTPVPASAVQPEGALTVKSAWIELPERGDSSRGHIDPSRFYIRQDAWLQDPQTLACRNATVGLVGLHLVYKTSSRPQWIWSTFEHVDNVPEKDDPPGKTYTFNDGNPGTRMTDGPEPDYQIPRPHGAPGPGIPPRPYQVERLQEISAATLAANRAWATELSTLGSVWRYYKLVTTQWPSFPSAPNQDATHAGPLPSCGGRDVTATANTTLETFLQTNKHCDPGLTCMGCHNAARATDFVWSVPLNPNQPPIAQRSPTPRAKALKALRGILQGGQAR